MAHSFTETLIEYALGRPYDFTDEDLASDIVAHAEWGFAVGEFIRTLTASDEFRTK